MTKEHELGILWTIAAFCLMFISFTSGVLIQRWNWEQDCQKVKVHVTAYGRIYSCEFRNPEQ